jgi:hypothetical protein
MSDPTSHSLNDPSTNPPTDQLPQQPLTFDASQSVNEPSTLLPPHVIVEGPTQTPGPEHEDDPLVTPELQNLLTLLLANNADLFRRQSDTLQTVLSGLSSGSRSDPHVDINKPDEFTGSDPRKLRPFIFTCELNFSSNPSQFSSDSKKVNYAVALLAGTALKWAQTRFTESPIPTCLSDWTEFKNELENLFGEPDVHSRAAFDLERLQMKNGHHAARFITDFFALASELNWGEEALEHAFYKRLAPRLKQQIALAGRRKGLVKLRAQVLELDQAHWELEAESSNPSASSKSNPNPNPKHARPNPQSASPGPSTPLVFKPSPRYTHPTQSSSPNRRPPIAPRHTQQFSRILAQDGKLKPEERQRRINANLCLYCGRPGHQSTQCPARKTPTHPNPPPSYSSAARAANTMPNQSESAGPSGSAGAPSSTPAPQGN